MDLPLDGEALLKSNWDLDSGYGSRTPSATQVLHHKHLVNYPCTLVVYGCQSTFASKYDWKRHITTQHMRPAFWRCRQCLCEDREPKDFNRKDLLMQHVGRMHPMKPSWPEQNATPGFPLPGKKAYLQQEADTCYVQRRSLPKTSGCPICPTQFSSWDERMNHIGGHIGDSKKPGGSPIDPQMWRIDEDVHQWLLDHQVIKPHGDTWMLSGARDADDPRPDNKPAPTRSKSTANSVEKSPAGRAASTTLGSVTSVQAGCQGGHTQKRTSPKPSRRRLGAGERTSSISSIAAHGFPKLADPGPPASSRTRSQGDNPASMESSNSAKGGDTSDKSRPGSDLSLHPSLEHATRSLYLRLSILLLLSERGEYCFAYDQILFTSRPGLDLSRLPLRSLLHHNHASTWSASMRTREARSRSMPPSRYTSASGSWREATGCRAQTSNEGASTSGTVGVASLQGTLHRGLIRQRNHDDDDSADRRGSKRPRLGDGRGKTDTEPRLPCIFHAGEPQRFPDHFKRYMYISELLRHLRSHNFYACIKCFTYFPRATLLEHHSQRQPCIKSCTNARCLRWKTQDTPMEERCDCILESNSKMQWRALFHLQYPDQEAPDLDSNLVLGANVAAASNFSVASPQHGLFNSDISAMAAIFDFGNLDMAALPSLSATAPLVDPALSILPLQHLERRIAQVEENISQPHTQRRLRSEQELNQRTERERQQDMVIGMLWQSLRRTESADAEPGSPLWQLMEIHAQNTLSTAQRRVSGSNTLVTPSVPTMHNASTEWMAELNAFDLNLPALDPVDSGYGSNSDAARDGTDPPDFQPRNPCP